LKSTFTVAITKRTIGFYRSKHNCYAQKCYGLRIGLVWKMSQRRAKYRKQKEGNSNEQTKQTTETGRDVPVEAYNTALELAAPWDVHCANSVLE
jgi:hypothetical protein